MNVAALALAFLLPAIIASGPAAQAATIADGLLLHFDPGQALGAGLPPTTPGIGEGTIADLSGRADTGTLVNMQGDPMSGFVGDGTARAPYALAFDGEDDLVTTRAKVSAPGALTIAVWFRTSQPGGKLIGIETSQTGSSSDYDRALVMSDDGRLHALAYRHGVGWATASTPQPVADGKWHLAVLTYASTESTGALQLHLDGELVASRDVTGKPSTLQGYWRIGGGTTAGVPSPTRHPEYWGQLATIRVYGRIIETEAIRELTQLGPVGDAAAWSAPRSTVPDAASLAEGLALHYDPARPGDLAGGIEDLAPTGNRGLLRRMAGPASGLVGEGTRDIPRAIAFDGVDDLVTSGRKVRAPDGFSIQLWFRSTFSGGKLVGIETSQDGSSSDYDRLVYVTDDGRIGFGTWVPGLGGVSVFSQPGHVDGRWHHVVGTRDVVQGAKLYVDGELVDHNETTKTHGMDGYWRFGGGTLGSWPSVPRKAPFRGQLADLRIYERPLGEAEVAALRARGPAGSGIPQPLAIDVASDLLLHLDARDLNETGGLPDRGPLGNHGQMLGEPSEPIGAGTAESPRAIVFDGKDDRLATTLKAAAPDAFTLSLWFRPDDAGGKLVGFETSRDGSSSDYDRVAYVSDDGRAHFGVWVPGKGGVTLSNTETVVDGDWHHLVAVKGAEGGREGIRLLLDGKLVQSDTTRKRYDLDGYWRVGGGTIGSWADAPRDTWFEGGVASLRIYGRALGDAEVRALGQMGPHGEAPPVVAPTPIPTTPTIQPPTPTAPIATPVATPAATPTPPGAPTSGAATTAQKGQARGYAAARYVLFVDGEAVHASSLEGCNPRATVVVEPLAGGLSRKHLGKVEYVPCVLTVTELPAKWLAWVQESARGNAIRKEVQVEVVDHAGKSQRAVRLTDAILTEVAMPAADASSKDVARIRLTIVPEVMASTSSSGGSAPSMGKTASKLAASSHFRVTVSGMSSAIVTRVSAPAWEQQAVEVSGADRFVSKEPGRLVVRDLEVTMSEARASEWLVWAKRFLLDGHNSEADERTVTIEYLSRDTKTVLRTVQLGGVGLVTGDVFVPTAGAGESAGTRSFKLYAETIAIT